MCEYCDLSNYKSNYLSYEEDCYEYQLYTDFFGGCWVYGEIRYDKKSNRFAIFAVGDGEGYIDINYCPMCGRKLIEDDEDDEEDSYYDSL